MELGADKRSLLALAGVLAVLLGVLYFQFFRHPPAAAPQAIPPGSPQPTAAASGASARTPAGARAQRRGDGPADPMTADVTLRTDLLERVRGIEEPQVDRNIFQFGRPKPAAPAPPPELAERAQQLLEAAQQTQPAETQPAPAAAPPPKPPARPPSWKYYGHADDPSSAAARAFLLDGEEILIVREGTLVRGRYLITGIEGESISLRDRDAAADFTIGLEAAP